MLSDAKHSCGGNRTTRRPIRFSQEENRSGLHGARPRSFVGMTRDENDGNAVTLGDQPVLQIKAAQTRHLQIGDEARHVTDLLGCVRNSSAEAKAEAEAEAL
jgi:hypothetical protein